MSSALATVEHRGTPARRRLSLVASTSTVTPVPGGTGGGRGVGRTTLLRRRLVAVVALMMLLSLAAVALGGIGADAELEDRVAGHVVIEPGQTLWDVAVATAPDGFDPRRQLADLRELNGIDGSHVGAWTVVLIPAR